MHPLPPLSRSLASPLRRKLVMALPLLAVGAATSRTHASPVVSGGSRALMGTRVDILIVAGSTNAATARVASEAAWRMMEKLAGDMSRHAPTSLLSRIGVQAGISPVTVSTELMQVLQAAVALSHETGGAFDATIGALSDWRFDGASARLPAPERILAQRARVDSRALHLDLLARTAYLDAPGMALDLGGIAKLPILEAGMRVLHEHGVTDALINGGGDVITSGTRQGEPWRIGLRDPRAPSRLLGTIALAGNGVVASSGDYERGFWHEGRRMHHVLDPATGYPTQGVRGVALIAASVADVNGLGVATMVKGMAPAREMLALRPAVHAVAVGEHGMWQTPALAGLGDTRRQVGFSRRGEALLPI
ncbi:Thiamin biosynthesis lipoprotein ApbE [plant metagenome]|uniref:FAD:protein FMN transferase n=1 Tax=plant metagenome TaxID=1297885 RepID=A0A484TDF2_9ZZZZ